jgi:hypothetical protein
MLWRRPGGQGVRTRQLSNVGPRVPCAQPADDDNSTPYIRSSSSSARIPCAQLACFDDSCAPTSKQQQLHERRAHHRFD